MRRLAVIGVGNMGEALVRGVVRAGVVPADAVVVCDARAEVAGRVASALGARVATLAEAVQGADAVILAVKPQGMALVLEAARPHVAPGTVVLSVAAGVSLATLEGGLQPGVEVVRTMPNTPALVGLGASAYALGAVRSGRSEAVAKAVLGSVGIALAVPEQALDAVTALSGSGPAYVFRMLEAMIDAGRRVGLEGEVAAALAKQTLLGAATLAMGELPPEELRRRVTSPGGTTEAALKVMEARGWAGILSDAIEAARARGEELGRGVGAGTETATAGALARVHAATAAGRNPVAILDLDLTLVENAPRTRAVLRDWLATLDDPRRDEALAFVDTMPLVFSIRDNLAAVARSLGREGDAELLRHGLSHWRKGFFDPANLVHDVALEGAPEAVTDLVAAGATVVYLTARPSALAAGTVDRLRALGFPIAEPAALLVTKADPAEGDEAFKVRALAWCGRLGEVVLCAENEPSHANAMHRAFPGALTVLIDTRHSLPAPEPASAIRRVARFCDAL